MHLSWSPAAAFHKTCQTCQTTSQRLLAPCCRVCQNLSSLTVRATPKLLQTLQHGCQDHFTTRARPPPLPAPHHVRAEAPTSRKQVPGYGIHGLHVRAGQRVQRVPHRHLFNPRACCWRSHSSRWPRRRTVKHKGWGDYTGGEEGGGGVRGRGVRSTQECGHR